jgi:hypothetical protein
VPTVTFTELHGNRADGFADLTAIPFQQLTTMIADDAAAARAIGASRGGYP